MALALLNNSVKNWLSDRQLQCIVIQGKINQLKSQKHKQRAALKPLQVSVTILTRGEGLSSEG